MIASSLSSPVIILLFTLLGFLLGSLPISVWLGRALLRGQDVRAYGDGNPGATNALRAGGWQLGLIVLLLDVSKAAAPVGYAYRNLGLQGWEILPIALAPTLGHAFSPFLGWRGGKALATILGAWIGLTLIPMPAVLLSSVILLRLLTHSSGWSALAAAGLGLAYLLLTRSPLPLAAVMAAQLLLIAWKHRAELGRRPTPSPSPARHKQG